MLLNGGQSPGGEIIWAQYHAPIPEGLHPLNQELPSVGLVRFNFSRKS